MGFYFILLKFLKTETELTMHISDLVMRIPFNQFLI